MSFFGVSSKNSEQKIAMQALIDERPYLFLTGPAGTGKTLITEAVGLHMVTEQGLFRKLIYTRLQLQLGGNQGAIPGDFDEKTAPFTRPFVDNFEVFSNKDALEYLTSGDEKKRKVLFEPIQTMRGGSMLNSFVIVDEAQNLDVDTIHALATRIGENSKMVFLGNFSQIDNKRLREPENNGLYRLLNGLYHYDPEKEFFEHVNLETVERHKAVTIVEQILRDHKTDSRFITLEKSGNYVWYEGV